MTLSPCTPHEGLRNAKGYGIIGRQSDGSRLAHRAALTAALGRPLVGHALHRCDNPPCVNPEHLYEGDDAKNADDRVERGRQRGGRYDITHCANGHELTGDNVQTYQRTSTRTTFTARRCLACRRANNIKQAAKRKAKRAEQTALRKAN